MDNIILIGMPTCGKTTLGKRLARKLGCDFLDTDDVIRQRNGCRLQEIIEREGRDGFMQREEEAVCSVHTDHTVIATGGSVVYSPTAMAHLKSLGRVVYLYITYPMLKKRMGDPHARGVVLAPGFTLKDLYDERTRLYEQYADITLVEQPDSSAETWVNDLLKLL